MKTSKLDRAARRPLSSSWWMGCQAEKILRLVGEALTLDEQGDRPTKSLTRHHLGSGKRWARPDGTPGRASEVVHELETGLWDLLQVRSGTLVPMLERGTILLVSDPQGEIAARLAAAMRAAVRS